MDIDFAANSEGAGLYFLFWSAYDNPDNIEKQDQIYPLYVGITGRSFGIRFKEHITRGVVSQITSGKWPKEGGIRNLNIIAYTKE